MGMEMSMGFGMYQRPEMNAEMRLGMKQLMLQLQLMQEPDIPNAVQGVPGIRIADNILKTNNAVGLLIGGLSQAAWNKGGKLENLQARKDVDVMIISDEFTPDRFEGGIDWWVREEDDIRIVYDASAIETKYEWWQNGNGVVLNYRIQSGTRDWVLEQLKPGLHLPKQDDVVEMAVRVAEAMIDERVEVDIDDLMTLYREKVERTVVRKNLMPNFRESTGITVLDGRYGTDVPLPLETVDLRTRAAIKGRT